MNSDNSKNKDILRIVTVVSSINDNSQNSNKGKSISRSNSISNGHGYQ